MYLHSDCFLTAFVKGFCCFVLTTTWQGLISCKSVISPSNWCNNISSRQCFLCIWQEKPKAEQQKPHNEQAIGIPAMTYTLYLVAELFCILSYRRHVLKNDWNYVIQYLQSTVTWTKQKCSSIILELHYNVLQTYLNPQQLIFWPLGRTRKKLQTHCLSVRIILFKLCLCPPDEYKSNLQVF